MGSHPSGELAARIVVETLPAQLRATMASVGRLSHNGAVEAILKVVTRLSRQIHDESQNQLGLGGMGSTVVLAWIHGDQALVVHLGDSSAFLLRDNLLQRLTNSHTLMQLLLSDGTMTLEQSTTHPATNRLTRYVGMPGDALPEAGLLEWRCGDRLLLCSDGLTRSLDDDELRRILAATPEPDVACRRLIDAANEEGGRDNITALIVYGAAGVSQSAHP